ncbi:aldehyde dehydrogenase (NADP(+)) [Phycisphaerales bacterium AB-hyl4]|uniref:Aldehyde dehydrogenase (NADP(+)) n=1 Tax=Natronomicrosphaera hydrolytica TaxID=3242702 RepID=A0ABV4U2V1_9BACT
MTQRNKVSVSEAVEGAAACAEGVFATLPAEDRAALLEAIATRVDALGQKLTDVAGRETHLPAGRLETERGRTVNQLRMFAALVREGSWVDARIDRAQPERQPMPKPDIRRMLVPIGPIVVFGASNFPLAFSVAGGDTASALAAGCPVVCKAHPAHPQTSDLVADAIAEAIGDAGLPAGVFTLVHTDHHAENLDLVRHPAVRGVGFTGSHKAGRALFDAANEREQPIPVFAEMGSVNPVVLLPGAVRERGDKIADGLHQSFTMGVGQFCTKPGIVLTLKGEATSRLIDRLAESVAKTPTGAMLHEQIAEQYVKSLGGLRAMAGVQTVAVVEAGEAGAGGAAVLRTEASEVIANAALLEECFGPTTLVIEAEDMDELERLIATIPGQLTATIHMADADQADAARLLPKLQQRAGRVLFNGFPTGVDVCSSMQHGGPYPATTDSRFTSVGTAAIYRWARPVCYQDAPASLLPPPLQDDNPCGIWRTIDGTFTKDAV